MNAPGIKSSILFAVFATLINITDASAQSGDTLCLIQINDIYEISPLEGGRAGGIARIATVINEHRKRYSTYTLVAGDFLNPSVMGTAVVDKERLNGKQMVDMFNRIGVDFVAFGNHEFDLGEAALQKRIDESAFQWIGGNVRRSDGSRFHRMKGDRKEELPDYICIRSPNCTFSVGLFSLTLPSNVPEYTKFLDYDVAMKDAIPKRHARNHLPTGLTHLSVEEDAEILRGNPRIRLLMGGHEHEHMSVSAGNGFVTKADANGKSIYRHLIYRDASRKFVIDSRLIPIDESILPDPATDSAVRGWEALAYASFRKSGFDPDKVVVKLNDTLNGMESSIRYEQNLLGRVVTEGLKQGSDADAAFINCGSIRIDDRVVGTVTELDIIRVMPFGGRVVDISMKGDLLLRTVRTNDNRKGLGGYLQLDKELREKDGAWTLKGSPIDPQRVYKVRTIEFLTMGKELQLEFLTDKDPSFLKMDKVNDEAGNPLDIRKTLITYLQKIYK
jgi:2',3'-cyclic-nucleotide 2'-phosphodiesterase (5'-nucleotidase family)